MPSGRKPFEARANILEMCNAHNASYENTPADPTKSNSHLDSEWKT